jgi:hypothetical protein
MGEIIAVQKYRTQTPSLMEYEPFPSRFPEFHAMILIKC